MDDVLGLVGVQRLFHHLQQIKTARIIRRLLGGLRRLCFAGFGGGFLGDRFLGGDLRFRCRLGGRFFGPFSLRRDCLLFGSGLGGGFLH